MKFARYLDDTQTQEWKRAYIDYRLLKKRINVIRRVQDGNPDSSTDEASDDEHEPEPPNAPKPPRTPTAVAFRAPSPEEFRESTESQTPLRRNRRSSTIVSHAKSLRSPASKGLTRSPSKPFSLAPARLPKMALQEILLTLTSIELAFFATLDEQLEKIEKFYQAREAELQARAKVLREQLEELGDHKKFIQGLHSKPLAWTSILMNKVRGKLVRTVKTSARSRHETLYGEDTIELSPTSKTMKGKQKESGHHEDGSGTVKEAKTLPTRHNFSFDPEDYLHAKKKLKKAVLEHYRGLELLHNYRILNITGFRKALKKLEKVTHIPAQDPYMSERVERSAFASDKNLSVMMEEMESLYTIRFARNDRKRAKDRLKAGSHIKSHHYSTFRFGIFLGLALPPLVSGIWRSYQPSIREAIPAWDALLFVYGVLGVPVLFSILVGLNLLVWARARINYGFIFELDTRTRLDYREYFEIPGILFVALCYALWFSFRIDPDTVSPKIWPLVWLGICFVVMTNPLPIVSRSSRYWLLRSVGKLLLSGTRPVEFTDFWMGDQFCSLGFTLSNLYLFACVYGTGFDSQWRKCGMTGRLWPIAFFLASLPLAVRLVQSVKRYVDSGLITHLINGGKYGSGIISNLFFYLWRHQGSRGRGRVFVLWCLTNSLYSIYASSWDYWMDWSLLRVHAPYPLLREELIYTESIPLYYFALISNLVIRFIWVIYIPRRGPDISVRTFIAGVLEIFRRWQWNFYRLENEHLGNMDQYRATREVPLPYTFAVEEDDDADDQEIRDLRPRPGSLRRRKTSQSVGEEGDGNDGMQ